MKKLKVLTVVLLITSITVIAINYFITKTASHQTYNSINHIPKNKVGLVLGTSKTTSNGNINLYYTYRLKAAIELFRSGKIEFILISGDNSRKDYNEPIDFKNDLIKNGIPENKIYLDYAGFRTLDSIVRAKEIFGLNAFTIISQKFHNERALYLSRHYNINAIAFNAKDVQGRYGLKTKLRESVARTKASLDMMFNVQPKFLGERIEIK